MSRTTLAMQAGAIRHVLPIAEKHAPSVVDALNDCLKTLEFLGEYQAIVKAAIKLQRSEPALAEVFKCWPDATFIDMRHKK